MDYYQYYPAMDDMNTLVPSNSCHLSKLSLVGGVVALCATGSVVNIHIKEEDTDHWVLPS